MRRARSGFILATALACALPVAGAAWAQVHAMPYANRAFPPGTSNRADLDDRVTVQTKLKKLRNEAITMQKADGGVLTPEHRDELEERLAALHREACAVGLAGCPAPARP